ncbi:MAG: 2Fe-2S iron-sulfur cluster-binding protein [Spirochaetaceae bacterium]|nr:2Fe-2S iron-sulfur cluster-binding protein [Spirochaetaceae bacterium]
MINIIINSTKVDCKEDQTILEAAGTAGIEIPTICFHERLTPPGLCRQCVVEVEGARILLPSCITKVKEGMVIFTESEKVIRVRRTILEMLAASTDLSEAPGLKEQMKKYHVDTDRFRNSVKREYPVKDDNPFYIRDYSKCILCERCVQVCSEDIQFSFALTTGGRGFENRITTFYDKNLPQTSCVFCGNCITVCPTNALIEKAEYSGESNE